MNAPRPAQSLLPPGRCVALLTVLTMCVLGTTCLSRWGWQSAAALFAGAGLGSLCLLGHFGAAALGPTLTRAHPRRRRRIRGALYALVALRTLLIAALLGLAICRFRLPPAELAGGYTAILIALALVGLLHGRAALKGQPHAR